MKAEKKRYVAPLTDEGAAKLGALIVEAAVDDWKLLARTGQYSAKRFNVGVNVGELREFFNGALFDNIMSTTQVPTDVAIDHLERMRQRILLRRER